MIKVDYRPHRTYFATAVIVALMHLSRSQQSHGGSAQITQIAGFADMCVFGALALAFWVVMRTTSPRSMIGRLNHGAHWIIALLLLLISGMSQMLFIRTGELLNLDMLNFFLTRIGDFWAVAAGGVGINALAMPLLAIFFVALASLQVTGRWLAAGRLLALLFPIGLVLANPLIQPAPLSMQPDEVLPVREDSESLYQGIYKNIGATHATWNSIPVSDWRRGILTGMPGAALGGSALDVLANEMPVETIYSAPHLESRSAAQPNVLMVILESLRFDALGVPAEIDSAPGGVGNMPFLDDIAHRGWRVENTYTTIPHTSKALVGIYCGTFARMETSISESVPGNLPLNCLPRLLKEAGYRSAHFQTAIGTFEDRLQFLDNAGFDERFTQESLVTPGDNWAKLAYLGIDDHAMIDPAIKWMSGQKRKGTPFFASMLTITTHHPYVTPLRIQSVGTPAEAKAAYRNAVAYTDKWLQKLFSKLESGGLLDNTLVIITGDHGEAFAEHGLIGHNAAAYEEGVRVPLILYGSMLGKARTVKGLRQHIDIMPTVLDVAGMRYSGKLPGKSLRDVLPDRSGLIASCLYSNYCLTYLTENGRKLIFFYGKRRMEMYDLNDDPLEKYNIYNATTDENALQLLTAAANLKASFQAVYGAKNTH